MLCLVFLCKIGSGDMGAFGPPPVRGPAPTYPLTKRNKKWQKLAIYGFLYFAPPPPVHYKFSVTPFILRGGGFIQGNQYKLFRMTPLSYHGYSVSESSSQGAVAYFKNFYVCFHLFFFIAKPLQGI